jgi:hypothetical protein
MDILKLREAKDRLALDLAKTVALEVQAKANQFAKENGFPVSSIEFCFAPSAPLDNNLSSIVNHIKINIEDP